MLEPPFPEPADGEIMPIVNESDLVSVRYRVRDLSKRVGLSLVDETRLVTAVSELSRNCLVYGGGGTAALQQVRGVNRLGVRITLEDRGPGIADIELAMKNGYSTGKGLGLGLPGSRRLVHEFEIQSQLGVGTRVSILRWKS